MISNNYSAVGIDGQISTVHSPIYNDLQENNYMNGLGENNSPYKRGQTGQNQQMQLQQQLQQKQQYYQNSQGAYSQNFPNINQTNNEQQQLYYDQGKSPINHQYHSNQNQIYQQQNGQQSVAQPIVTINHQTRRSISNNSTKSFQGPKMSQFITAVSSVPAIPGKNQRIIINKNRGVSSSKSANRIFNKSTYGKQNTQNRGETNGQYSSFISASHTLNHTSNKSFNATGKRFDTTYEMKELFNKDPGPGTYSISTADTSVMGGSSVASQSTKGVGNGFVSKTQRFKEMAMNQIIDPLITVGPGQYDPKPVERHVAGPKIDAKAGFTLPFNEKNPLNYVRPITVNIYFKQQYPAVGTYNPDRIKGNVPSCMNVFQSQADRNTDARRLRQAVNEPAPNSYDHINGFDLAERDRDAGSQPFRMPLPKKIVPVNIYDPHAPVEDKRFKGAPGPGKYNIPTQFVKEEEVNDSNKYFYTDKGKLYADNNLDRFGKPIMPRRPRDLVPGPGEYNITPRGGNDDQVVITKGGYISQEPAKQFPQANNQKVPGPAFYNANQEPKKISFLFNAAEKWTH
eukprot:403361955